MKKYLLISVMFLLSMSVAFGQTVLLQEGFEETDATGTLPNASSLVTAPSTYSCTNGTWGLFKMYRSTSSPTSGSYALRALKSNHTAISGIGYIVTPGLESIGKVTINYKRGRPITIDYSTDSGSSWVGTYTAPDLYSSGGGGVADVTYNVTGTGLLLRIQNTTSGDEDLDNLVVTAASGSGVEISSSNVPTELSLNNYPNPFNPSTKIIFSVKTTGKATVKVYDLSGREVAKVFDDVAKAGEVYQVPFGFEIASSGIYFARLESKDGIRTQKMVFMK